jgi:hypothetical protein
MTAFISTHVESVTRRQKLTLESLVDVDSLLGTGLKVWNVSFGLAKGHGSLV